MGYFVGKTSCSYWHPLAAPVDMLSQKKSGKRWPPLRPRRDLHHVWVSGSYAAIRAPHWCGAAIHMGTTPVWPYIRTPQWFCGQYIRAPVQCWGGVQSRDDISLDLPPCTPITTVQWSSCWRLHGGTVGQAHTHLFLSNNKWRSSPHMVTEEA